MNVGINLLYLKPKLAGGTETYSMGLLKAIANLDDKKKIVYYVFCSSEVDLAFLQHVPQFNIIRFNRVSRSLTYRFFFEQLIFPFILKKYKLHILHSHGYVGPIFAKNHVVTIHDTNSFAHKNAMPLPKRLLLSFFLIATSKTCRHIITVSKFSKNEIIKNLKVPQSKITVIYEACQFDESEEKKLSLSQLDASVLQNPYFMGLSSLSPHKNIQTLVKAYKLFADKHEGTRLVLAGHLPAGGDALTLIKDASLKNNIIITGYVDNDTLSALLKNALCFVFPSLYEGFGLPLLEAQHAGIPVIASNRGSLPEIGGESVVYFDAEDAVMLSEKMNDLFLDENKRTMYVKLGTENLKRFSWETAAKETLKIYYLFNNS